MRTRDNDHCGPLRIFLELTCIATLYVLTLERSTGWAGGDGRNIMAKVWSTTGLIEMNDEQSNRIAENLREFDWETATFDEMEDLFEDRDPCEFL